MGQNIFQEFLTESIKTAYQKSFQQPLPDLFFERPPKPEYGDIALACFIYAGILKKSPHEIAKQIAATLLLPPAVSKVEALGAYVNFTFAPAALAKKLFSQLADGSFGKINIGNEKTVVIEFSAPNANKPLHLGHGRNNAVGVFLVRLAKVLGFSAVAVNLINDRGVHICKSMLAYQLQGQQQTPETTAKKGDHFVGDYYVAFANLAKEDPSYEKRAQSLLQLWEKGEAATVNLWRTMVDWVLGGFRLTYRRAGVEFDHYYYESDTYKTGKDLVLKALEAKICQEEDNGAVVIDLSAEKLGQKVLLRGDKTSVYITQDIYTTVKKFNDHKADMAYWVVGVEQEHYFKVLFAVLKRFGYPWADKCFHISYGMIELPGGKMKSREGNTVDLDNLYDQMQDEAYALLREKNPTDERSEAEFRKTAEAVGQAAINFFILKSTSTKKIIFNRQESLNFDGMTGPYLQYTFARISSLLKKAGTWDTQENKADYHWNEEESALLKQCIFFEDTLKNAWENKNPSPVAYYAYDLCRAFNKFYYLHPVLKQTDHVLRTKRLNLICLIRETLQKCLYLLNIEALNRM